MFFLSYKILKISTRQDRQLRMRRNCHATLGTRFQVCLFQVYFVGHFFRPDDFLYVWKGDVLGGSVLVEEHLFSNHWILGTKYSGMFSCSCRLILSQVNSSALRSEWRLMLLLHLGNKDCLNPGKTGCFLYLFWFIVCLKSLFELRENWTYLQMFANVRSVRSQISCFRKRWWTLAYCLYHCTIIYMSTILNLNEDSDWKRMRWRANTSTKVECAWKS